MVISVMSGMVAGVLHVMSGPDHLTAIAPLAVDERRQAWNIGLRWGLGHTAGVALVGALALCLRGVLPLDWLSSWSERLVGVVLIGIGIWGFLKALSNRLHVHQHEHDGQSHVHAHVHLPHTAHREPGPHVHTHTALAVGALHGLAGSSHLAGVLPALAFPSNSEAVLYLGAFGLGTILGMTAFSSLVGSVAKGFAASGLKYYRLLMGGCSVASIMVGGYWLI